MCFPELHNYWMQFFWHKYHILLQADLLRCLWSMSPGPLSNNRGPCNLFAYVMNDFHHFVDVQYFSTLLITVKWLAKFYKLWAPQKPGSIPDHSCICWLISPVRVLDFCKHIYLFHTPSFPSGINKTHSQDGGLHWRPGSSPRIVAAWIT